MFVAEELQCKNYIKHWFITQWPNDIEPVAHILSFAGRTALNPGEKLRFCCKKFTVISEQNLKTFLQNLTVHKDVFVVWISVDYFAHSCRDKKKLKSNSFG